MATTQNILIGAQTFDISAHLYAGSGSAANAATTNGNTKLTITNESTVRNNVSVVGTGATSVTSDANGKITINSTDTTYSSQAAVPGGTAVSLVTTGEKYTWNHKLGSSDIFAQASSATNMPVHSYYYNTSNGTLAIKLDPGDMGNTSRLWITMYAEEDSEFMFEASVPLVNDGIWLRPMLSSHWTSPERTCIHRDDTTVFVQCNMIYTLESYIINMMSGRYPLVNLKSEYDGQKISFYIYVTK